MNGFERKNGVSLLPEDIFAVFSRLGFSKYEAKAYATLCACGRLKMGMLAKYADIPNSKIYEVLGNLERKGAVVVYSRRPTTAESIPLEQIVQSRVKQYLQDAKKVLGYVKSIEYTDAFKHLYHTRRIALRSLTIAQ